MKEHRITTIILPISLLFLSLLMALTPGSEAEEYEDHYENLKVPNNDYWADNIAYLDTGDRFEITVTELDGLSMDVYILDRVEYELYQNNLPFTAEYSAENIESTGLINWTCPDDVSYFLVVDNKKNAHLIDAYAMEDISVNLTWVNTTEKEEFERVEEAVGDISDGIDQAGLMCCGSALLIAFCIIGVLVYFWRKDERSKKFSRQERYQRRQTYNQQLAQQQEAYNQQGDGSEQDSSKPGDSSQAAHATGSRYPPQQVQSWQRRQQQRKIFYPLCPYLQQIGVGAPSPYGKSCPANHPKAEEVPGEEESEEESENESEDENVLSAESLEESEQ